MTHHMRRHAEETADFLNRKGPAFKHLRIFWRDCQLLPFGIALEDERLAAISCPKLIGHFLPSYISLLTRQPRFEFQNAAWPKTIAKHLPGSSFCRLRQSKSIARKAQCGHAPDRIATKAAYMQNFPVFRHMGFAVG